MTKDLIIRGVPRALALDMWWMDDATKGASVPARTAGAMGRGLPLAALAGLEALADVLFYRHAPGLSLAVLAAAIFGVVVRLRGTHGVAGPAALLVLSMLPVVEHVQDAARRWKRCMGWGCGWGHVLA